MTPPRDQQSAPESKAARLRRLIASEEILVMPGIFDGYSARLVQKAGYAAAFITGSGLSEARLGWADMGVMGGEDNIAACRQLVGATELPLIADGDTGYGNAVNVHFTVKGFERAGACGLMIEDQVWPKRCGHMSGKAVIPAEEAAEKIRALPPRRARRSGFHHQVAHGRVCDRWPGGSHSSAGTCMRRRRVPTSCSPTPCSRSTTSRRWFATSPSRSASTWDSAFGRRSTTPLLSARQLQDLGVAVVIYPRLLTPPRRFRAWTTLFAALRESIDSGDVVDRPDLQYSFEQINDLTGLPALQELERRHAVGGEASRPPPGAD